MSGFCSFILAIIFIHEGLESVLLIGLPIYSFLLLTMSWRAMARAANTQPSYWVVDKLCGICSFLFVISDGLIAFDKFYTPIPNRTVPEILF